ncbi:inositol monophosphatase family protein [Leptospira idonii]|uniref:Inositol-1-monophosphatase n=1 Tax=Leptospira idonii TaxID=1193500 RepID=A0A4R9LTU8_9LEPT|nr:inositol monophosphatase family protein [Leptospira idonii]TGN17122.1 inositol monophosphatase [Leptospira idonii]
MESELKDRSYHFLNFLPSVGNFLAEKHLSTNLQVSEKGTYDLVTEADLGAEKMVLDEIQKFYPHDGFLSEEFGEHHGDSGFRWIIDPLDGTTNYTHGLPLYGVSVAVEHEDTKQPVIGMVYFPELNTFYHSIKGKGAFRDKTQIHVSTRKSMKEALFVTGFPYDRNKSLDVLMVYYKSILQKSRGIRRTGAATLDLCWIADGKFDGYYELGLKPWDMAAAGLIVQEAGGMVTTMDGNDFNVYTPSILATNGLLHEFLLNEFEGHINRVVY